jgi:galactose mutarotase-like enzyme
MVSTGVCGTPSQGSNPCRHPLLNRLFLSMEKKQKIFNVKALSGNEVSFSPSRGGIITSLKFSGTEILYLDNKTFVNTAGNVRGGIPILFPNAGIVESSNFPGLKQHGFARNSDEWKSELIPNGFRETLLVKKDDQISYPYDCSLSVEGTFPNENSFTLIQKVENLEESAAIPIAFGLHPYFKVANEEKKNIRFNFEGGQQVQDQAFVWMNGGTVIIDNPKLKDPSAVLEISIPKLGTVRLDVSIEYKKLWIWSVPGENFFCVEPAMRDIGGLTNDPTLIKPAETFSASVTFSLKE